MNTDKIYAEQLANEYAPKDTSKVVALRKLDARAKLPASIFTYTFGIITALITGVGMCLSMNVIGSGTTAMFVLGVIIGIIGLVGMSVNYPIYHRLLARGDQEVRIRNHGAGKGNQREVTIKKSKALIAETAAPACMDTGFCSDSVVCRAYRCFCLPECRKHADISHLLCVSVFPFHPARRCSDADKSLEIRYNEQ